MDKIIVTKLEQPIFAGRGNYYRYQAAGPGTEIQNFYLRKNADLYAKIRRATKTAEEATREYARS